MFNATKILQEIIYLLHMNNDRMNLLKLMKELYLIDRLSISERDTSVSGDSFYSMPHGPILSATLNLLNSLTHNSFGEYLEAIETKRFPDISIKKTIDFDLLSEKEKEYIQNISDSFKNFSAKEIENYTHELPEWEDPKGSSKKIKFRDIMKALGSTESEIQEAKEEYEFINQIMV